MSEKLLLSANCSGYAPDPRMWRSDLAPDFQVVITDHADLRSDDLFQRAVVEKWWESGKALVPADW